MCIFVCVCVCACMCVCVCVCVCLCVFSDAISVIEFRLCGAPGRPSVKRDFCPLLNASAPGPRLAGTAWKGEPEGSSRAPEMKRKFTLCSLMDSRTLSSLPLTSNEPGHRKTTKEIPSNALFAHMISSINRKVCRPHTHTHTHTPGQDYGSFFSAALTLH